jgi:Kef-type K+ transport system membrane component KefB/nucleotide-binding universal stress UspA family protein
MELISQFLSTDSLRGVARPTTQVLGEETIVTFAVLLVVILVIPILFERLRLPGFIGLVLSGLVLGQSGWNLLHAESGLMKPLSEIALLYLMFVAGLELELKHFYRRKHPSLGFGILTFVFPLLMGILVGEIFDFEYNTSIFIGCLLASYTLLAYPIITRLGVVNNEAVSITVGAASFTNLTAVLVLAVCIATADRGLFDWASLIRLLMWLSIYTMLIVVGLTIVGKEFFRQFRDDEGHQFLFVLLTVFLATVGAQLMGVETIVGAFLAGLAVNAALGDGPVKEKVIFIGSVLFIPIFFVNFGLIIDLPALITSITTLELTLLIVVGLISSKFMAALFIKLLYNYNWAEILSMWSLSIPKMGITLAATFVGYRTGLLSEAVLNSFLVLIFVTSILGPWITSQTAVALVSTGVPTSPPTLSDRDSVALAMENTQPKHSCMNIVVPVYNPQSQQYLIEMAALLAHQAQGKIIPLAIATATSNMDAPHLDTSVRRSERLLAKATAQSRLLGVEVEPLLRIDDAFAPGISRAAREQKANLIIMGWGKRTGLRARLFGNVIDGVLWSSHCPVAVTRLVDSPKKIQRILVPLEDLTASSLPPVQFAQMLADANQNAVVTVLNVCKIPAFHSWSHSHNSMANATRSLSEKIAARRSHLASLMSQLAVPIPPEIQIIPHENPTQPILQAARLYDLVVLPFIRNRTNPGGLVISDVTSQLAGQLTCSIVMLGTPEQGQKGVLQPQIYRSNSVPKKNGV